jgi:hypothetical protein
MLDTDAEPAPRREHAADLRAHARHVIDVHQRVVGDHEIERAAPKWEHTAVREQIA